MIIAGNSNVSTFNQQGMNASTDHDIISVVWVGALKAEHFFNGHPAGKRVRELFSQTSEWKFLSIGIHDIFAICSAAAQGDLESKLFETLELYKRLFTELNGAGKLGWLVFPQAAHEMSFAGLKEEDVLAIAESFNAQVENWCCCEGITVINPLADIVGLDGRPLKHFLQKDGTHLNIEAAKLYLVEISRTVGFDLQFQNNDAVFEPRNETESFCSLLLSALNLPFERGIDQATLEKRLVVFVTGLLQEKGLDLVIDSKTELVDSGLLDSLNLVEIYTYALSEIRMETDFDVNLRSLDTIEKLACFLIEKVKPLQSIEAGPCFSDFLTSLRGDFDSESEQSKILEADYRIATMSQESVNALFESFSVVANNFFCKYGIIYFWMALLAAEKKDFKAVLQLLERAGNSDLAFPFSGPHLNFYLERWNQVDCQNSLMPLPKRETSAFGSTTDTAARAGSSVNKKQLLQKLDDYFQPAAGTTERFINVQPQFAFVISSTWQAIKDYEIAPFGTGFSAISYIISHIITNKLGCNASIPDNFLLKTVAASIECRLSKSSGQAFEGPMATLEEIDPAFASAEGAERSRDISRYANSLKNGEDLGSPLYITGAALNICGGMSVPSNGIFMIDGARRISASALAGRQSIDVILLMTEDEYANHLQPEKVQQLQQDIQALSWFNQYQYIPLVGIKGERSLNRFSLMNMNLLRDQVIMDFGCNLGQVCIKGVMAGARQVWGIEGMPDTWRVATEIGRLSGFPNLRYLNVDFNAPDFDQQIDAACPGQVDYSFFFSVYRTKELTQRDRLFRYIIDKSSKGIFFEGHADPKIDSLEYYAWLFETFGLKWQFLGNSEGSLRPLFFLALDECKAKSESTPEIRSEADRQQGEERILVAVNLVPTKDPSWLIRQETCIKSLDSLRGASLQPLNICFPDEALSPAGWDVYPVLSRSADQVLGVREKRKPFIRDIFDKAADYALAKGYDWFAYINNDIILTRELIDAVRACSNRSIETIAVSRNEVEGTNPDGSYIIGYLEYRGFDAFFCRTDWWQENREHFQPYIVGERAWDDAYAAAMLRHSHGKVFYTNGYCLHIKHETSWLSGLYATYNLGLYNGRDKENQDRLRNFVDDVGKVGAPTISEEGLAHLVQKHFKGAPPTRPAECFVNIGMVTYNRLEFTRQAIKALLEHTDFPYVLTVIDNNSQDGTKEYLVDLKNQGVIKNLVLLDKNAGVAKASNLAWSLEPKAGYYLKLDNDIVIQRGRWLTGLVNVVDRLPKVGAAAYNFEPNSYPLRTINGCKARIKPEGNLGGACILIPRRTHYLLGFWCEDYGLYGEEDYDYGIRIRLAGLENAYMEDEQIGIHLPAGRAAVINMQSYRASDGIEEELHAEYRAWKDEARRKTIASGILRQNLEAYCEGSRSLFVESAFAAAWAAKVSATVPTSSPALKIAVYSLDHPEHACPRIRVFSFAEALAGSMELKWGAELINNHLNIDTSLVAWADLIVVQRFFPTVKTAPFLEQTLSTGKPVVYETDDLLMNVPGTNPYQSAADAAKPFIFDLISKAAAVTVSTEEMKRVLAPYNQRIHVLPNLLDERHWSVPLPVKQINDPVVIGYAGTPDHKTDLELMEEVLERVATKYGNRVAFCFMGCSTEKIKRLPGFSSIKFEPGYINYARAIQKAGIDIGLVPLADNTFNRCKSNIKWLEYSACGIAGIYADLPPYNSCIEQGVTGLLVGDDPQKWFNAIDLLIRNTELRRSIVLNARHKVMSEYILKIGAQHWLEVHRDIFEQHRGKRHAAPLTEHTVKVSIIIPLFNKAELTRACLQALERTIAKHSYELLLIDNCSSDNTVNLLQEWEPKATIIRNSENRGFAAACNQGARAAKGKYLLFLNNDTEVTAGWLQPLITTLANDPTVAAVGSKLLFPDGTIQHAGVMVVDDQVSKDPLVGKHYYFRFPGNHPPANRMMRMQAVTAACVMIRGTAFRAVGGFDEGYWNGYEDLDLCFKLGCNNGKIIYQPASVVIHHESQSGTERFRRVSDNIRRLHERWLGRIKPDIIIMPDTSVLNGSGILEGLTGNYDYPSHFQNPAPTHATTPIEASGRYPLIPLVGHSASSLLQKLSSSKRLKGVLRRYTIED